MIRSVIVATLLFAPQIWARNSTGIADGSDWKQWSQSYKVGWIHGWTDAMSNAGLETAILCTFQLKPPPDSKEARACMTQAQDFNFEMIKFGQYLDGMDSFYKDFRNTEYPLSGAIKLVRDRIRGRPEAEIERELEAWRQCRADSSKCSAPANSKQAPN
jgi:hypothetical protein